MTTPANLISTLLTRAKATIQSWGALPSATLINPYPAASDNFGMSVAVDGNYAVVGAPFKDIGATDAGRAYIFNAATGVLVSTLVNPNPSTNDEFGNAVAISGNYAVVGAYLGDIGATDTGRAYVFQLA